MHCHGRFTGPCNTLNNDVMIRRFADNFILLFLNGCDNLAKDRLFILGKILCQQIIVGDHLTVKIVEQLARFDFISTFQFQINSDLFAARRFIAAFAKTILIISICHRRAPVHHHPVRGIFGNSTSADIDGFLLVKRLVMENNSSEIRLCESFFIADQRSFHMVMHGHCIIQNCKYFRVIIMIMREHLVNIFLHTRHLVPIICKVILYDVKRLFKVSFLRLS